MNFTPLPSADLLTALNWRYATKAFNPEARIPAETWAVLEAALVLTPSSFGLQPWKFIIVDSPALREQLLPHAWGQKQIVQASHLVVFTIVKRVDEAFIDTYLARQAQVHGVPLESLAKYRNVVVNHLKGFDENQLQDWAVRQSYIALGNLMTSAAVLGIDTCPLEGFIPAKFDEVLNLSASGLASSVLCALGYRADSDKYASSPKVRFPADSVIEHR